MAAGTPRVNDSVQDPGIGDVISKYVCWNKTFLVLRQTIQTHNLLHKQKKGNSKNQAEREREKTRPNQVQVYIYICVYVYTSKNEKMGRGYEMGMGVLSTC